MTVYIYVFNLEDEKDTGNDEWFYFKQLLGDLLTMQ